MEALVNGLELVLGQIGLDIIKAFIELGFLLRDRFPPWVVVRNSLFFEFGKFVVDVLELFDVPRVNELIVDTIGFS